MAEEKSSPEENSGWLSKSINFSKADKSKSQLRAAIDETHLSVFRGG